MIDDDHNQFVDTVLSPPFVEWPKCVDENRQRLASRDGRSQTDTTKLQRSILDAAHVYSSHLAFIAAEADLQGLPEIVPNIAAQDVSLIMTGHQPVVWHSGLVYKFIRTQQCASQLGAVGISILMDVDQGDAGAFEVPLPIDAPTNSTEWPARGIRLSSLTSTEGPYLAQRVADVTQLQEREAEVVRALETCKRTHEASRFRQAMAVYQRLAGQSIVDANVIVRRLHRVAGELLELPFSTLCELPQIQSFLADIMQDSAGFHQAYNQTLSDWRSKQGIRNTAQPFPDLDRSADAVELPMWRVDRTTGARQSVWVGADGIDPLGRSELLAPKGALITIVFRLLASDFFVHGLGGQTYDRFTDELVLRYFDVSVPHYAIASASRYLFNSNRDQLRHLDELASRQRELSHQPDRFVGEGWYSDVAEHQLKALIETKRQLVEKLRRKKSAGESAAEEGRGLQQVQHDIKSIVVQDFAARLAPLERMTDGQRAAIESRLYPWFYFDWQ